MLIRTVSNVEEDSLISIMRRQDDKNIIIVYGDIAYGIIGLVFKDIPKIYDGIVKDSELSKLTIPD